MPRHRRTVGSNPPQRRLDPVEHAWRENDELGSAVDRYDWHFDPAYPVGGVAAAGEDEPWDVASIPGWLRQEARRRDADSDDGQHYYREMDRWWRDANAAEAPVVLYQHDTVPGLDVISGGHHRYATAVSRGDRTFPAVVGRRKTGYEPGARPRNALGQPVWSVPGRADGGAQ